ncbi:hypothetical protein [Wukongibacter baidiensis]
MHYEYLYQFEKRMKNVGMYTLLNYNSFFKDTLKNYGFDPLYESTNIVFATLIFIMEKSLKEEDCTIDHISEYIFDINRRFFLKNLNREDSKVISDFIINTLLGNKGEAMYFKCFNFHKGEYEEVNISYLSNKTVYIDNVRRTSYFLTEDGYHFLLGTLEVESNLKLTVQEMIFKLHLEKADYSKAVDDVKQLLNLSKIQLQRIEESIRKIKENVLDFSSENYDSILEDNLSIVENQKKSFQGYREYIEEKEREIHENGISAESLKDDERALEKLNIIKKHLSRVINEQQKIISSHFDFKVAYSNALIDMTAFSVIKRINMRKDLYEPIIKDFSKIESLPQVLRPLFVSNLSKIYNLTKAATKQRVIKQQEDISEEILNFDEDSYKEEQERKLREKSLKYKGVLERVLLSLIQSDNGEVTLEEIINYSIGNSNMKKLVPSIELFREVMIELLKVGSIDINEVHLEARKSISTSLIGTFELNRSLLEVMEENKAYKSIKAIKVIKDMSTKKLKIYGAKTEDGLIKTVQCSNIIFKSDL